MHTRRPATQAWLAMFGRLAMLFGGLAFLLWLGSYLI